mgnify:CR=1 FL=1|tara:strand:+ start:55 stop:513 length:459 start_codon:yes stop_codon:yes gene_type:complete
MESINLIPITKMRVSIDRWLNTKVKYEDVLTLKDILEDMSTKSYEWINHREDLEHVQDCDSFKNEFIHLIYNYEIRHNYDMNHMTETEEELFDLKYLEEISELFNEYKETDNYYGLDLFKDDFNKYFEFIKHNVIIHEFNEDILSDDEYSEN